MIIKCFSKNGKIKEDQMMGLECAYKASVELIFKVEILSHLPFSARTDVYSSMAVTHWGVILYSVEQTRNKSHIQRNGCRR